MSVSIVMPVLNEAVVLAEALARLTRLDPAAVEVLVVDGGSSDASVEIAGAAGVRVIRHDVAGRAAQINRGVAEARGPLVCVLHADTALPHDAMRVIADTLTDTRVALAGFTPLIAGAKTRWGTSFHNWIKTWYAPLLFRPHLFARGVRLLFGDHAMFFRRDQFLSVGGCDPRVAVMEEADLCIKLAALGRVRLVPRIVRTSDRRIAAWGPLRANWIYVKVGLLWAFGARERLGAHYPDVR